VTALGGPYGTAAILKKRAGIPDSDTSRNDAVTSALATAAAAIHQYTGRQFGKTDTASERTFTLDARGADVHDFWTTDGLIIDGTAWDSSTSAYRLEPRDGIKNQVAGWPYERLARIYSTHPIYTALRFYEVEIAVTAKWGWAAEPADVTTASYMLAQDDLKSGDAPFGVAGFGDYVVRVRANPRVQQLLDPYVLDRLKVAS
jgi:hypothetical protein